MRGADIQPVAALRADGGAASRFDAGDDAERLLGPVSGNGRSALRAGLAWVDGFVPSPRVAQPNARALPRGRERPSRARACRWRRCRAGWRRRASCEDCASTSPVDANGYAWWYVDALSEDGREGLTIIAFIGSVFSPYYAWTGRRDPARPLRAERRPLRLAAPLGHDGAGAGERCRATSRTCASARAGCGGTAPA